MSKQRRTFSPQFKVDAVMDMYGGGLAAPVPIPVRYRTSIRSWITSPSPTRSPSMVTGRRSPVSGL
jgi:hypothetical protein